MRHMLLVIAGEVMASLGVLFAALLAVVLFSRGPTQLEWVLAGLMPLAIVQWWVLFILIRAFIRHQDSTRVRDYFRNYVFKAIAFIMICLVGANGIVHFIPQPIPGVILVLAIYVLGIPGIVELIRYYRSDDG